MSEITPLVNNYCQLYKEKEKLRKQCNELTKDLKDAHDKLLDEMTNADLRIIRSLTCGFDIKRYQLTKKPTSSIKKLKDALKKQDVNDEAIDCIFQDIQTNQTKLSDVIKLIPLSKTKADVPVIQ